MKLTKTSILAALALTAGAVAMASTGCELIASVDPSLVEGAGGTGGAAVTSSSSSGIGGSGSSSSGMGGHGGGGACTTPAMCPAPSSECKVATCTAGVCGEGNATDGTAIAMQQAGDCKKV